MWECAPIRNFQVIDFPLPSQYFPAGAESQALHEGNTSNGEPVAVGFQRIYWENYSRDANYQIDEYVSSKKAEKHYQWFLRNFKDENPYPVTIQSLRAQHFFVGCNGTEDDEVYSCKYFGVYEEFTFYLDVFIDSQFTLDDFTKVVTWIDEMAYEKIMMSE